MSDLFKFEGSDKLEPQEIETFLNVFSPAFLDSENQALSIYSIEGPCSTMDEALLQISKAAAHFDVGVEKIGIIFYDVTSNGIVVHDIFERNSSIIH